MWFGNRKTDSDLCLLQFRTAKSTSLISPRILEYICNERTLPQVAGFFHNDAKATERWAWTFYFLPLIVCINWVVNPSKIKWISERRYSHTRGSCNVQPSMLSKNDWLKTLDQESFIKSGTTTYSFPSSAQQDANNNENIRFGTWWCRYGTKL